MPNKNELLKQIESSTKQTYTPGEVRSFIDAVCFEAKYKPLKIKKGDVYSTAVGVKKRPCVIVKVVKGLAYSIPLSSSENEYNLISFKSRFLGNGYFSCSFSVASVEYVKNNFIGVFDSGKELNKAIELIKEEIKNI